MLDKHQKCRRKLLTRGVVMLAGIPVLILSRTTFAGMASKSDFHYQDHPNEGKKCSDCTEFLPPDQTTSSAGACRIVAGPISPDGWCMAFTKK